MLLEQLTDIIRAADQKAITKQLLTLGYYDCKKYKELRNLPIETLFNGKLEETATFPDHKGKRTYQGGTFTSVYGYEKFEFIRVNINDKQNMFPLDLLIWAKEITQ